MRFHIICAFSIALSACAAVNPNPNVGLRSVDLMVKGGNCPGATEILQSAAERGEPWAQLRLGYFAYTKQCPGVSIEEGNKWLTKVACYEAKTDWEKGRQMSIGPTGFFNTRDDSFNAIDVLQMATERGSSDVESMLAAKWYWTKLASDLYEPEHPTKAILTQRLQSIEQKMQKDTLNRAKELNICGPFRQQQNH